MQDDLDGLLRERVVPDARNDLAERIVAATDPERATSSRTRRAPRWFVWYQSVFALACVAVVIGFSTVLNDYSVSSNSAEIASVQDDGNAMDEIAMYMVYDSL